MAKKTGFILFYDMLDNLKMLGNDITVEVLTALSRHDQGQDIGALSPQAQFAVNSYLPAMDKAKRRWKASARNGGGNVDPDEPGEKPSNPNDTLDEASRTPDEPRDGLAEPSTDLAEPSGGLEGGVNVIAIANAIENVTVPENANVTAASREIDFSNDPKKLFIQIWQRNGDIFNALARIESPNEWEHFWATAPPTCDEVKAAMQNVIDDVKSGRLERRFIARSPDKFVLNGGLVRHKTRYKGDAKNSLPPSLAGKISLGDILDD